MLPDKACSQPSLPVRPRSCYMAVPRCGLARMCIGSWESSDIGVIRLQICTGIEAMEREQAQSESSISRFFKQARPPVMQAASQIAGA